MKTFSVRFYKRLILLILALMILIPTGCAVYLRIQNTELKRQLGASGEGTQPKESLLLKGESLDYQLLYPELYSTAEIPAERVREVNTAYLTFDCTPSGNTEEILDVLDIYGVKATFFIKGTSNSDVYEILRKIVDRGHTVGLRGYSDSYQQIYSSVSAFLEDFKSVYDLVYETTGVRAEIFRYPGGSINPYNCGFYQELNAEMLRRRFVFFDWDVSGEGSGQEEQTGDRLRENVLTGMEGKDRGIIALQDVPGGDMVVSALPGIIEGLRDKGYSMQSLTASILPVIYTYN